MRKISLIAAVAQNGIIGNGDKLPWKIKDDMKFFKETTMGHIVVMGRKTYESFGGRLLPGRFNAILTKQLDYEEKIDNQTFDGMTNTGYACISDIKDCMTTLKDMDLFIIGGAEIYKQFIPHATHFYRTKVLADVEGDIYFPELNEDDWVSEVIATGEKNERNEHPFIIEKLTHKEHLVKEILV